MSDFVVSTTNKSPYFNNPQKKVPIGLFLDEIDHITAAESSPSKEKFLTLIKSLHLATDTDGEIVNIDLDKISGGITNALYIVHLYFTASDKRTLILRLFGFGTEQFIDRSVENIVFSTLSRSGHGPTFYGLFDTGRIEGFLPDVQSLSSPEMSHPRIYPAVATSLLRLHQTSIPELSKTQDHWLWDKLQLFFTLAINLATSSPFNPTQQTQYQALDIPQVYREFCWYRSYMQTLYETVSSGDYIAINASSDVQDKLGFQFGQRLAFQRVLCHNDMLSGNIMRTAGSINSNDKSGENNDDNNTSLISEDTKIDITLIDYEYAGYNYRAYDFANHFCEFGGFEFEIQRDFPTESVRRDFIRHYLQALLGAEDVSDVDEDIVAGFEDIVLRFTLASHFFWGTWSIVQAASSTIDFDYLAYAGLRYAAYDFHGSLFVGDAFTQRGIEQSK